MAFEKDSKLQNWYDRVAQAASCVEVEYSLHSAITIVNDYVARIDSLTAEKEKRVNERTWYIDPEELQRYKDFTPWGGKPGRGDRQHKMRA